VKQSTGTIYFFLALIVLTAAFSFIPVAIDASGLTSHASSRISEVLR
jgi:hypothetical protein